MKNVKIQTGGMHCSSCEMLVIDSLEELPGIETVKASHKTGLVEVSFDEKKISEERIIEAIENEGYKVIE